MLLMYFSTVFSVLSILQFKPLNDQGGRCWIWCTMDETFD